MSDKGKEFQELDIDLDGIVPKEYSHLAKADTVEEDSLETPKKKKGGALKIVGFLVGFVVLMVVVKSFMGGGSATAPETVKDVEISATEVGEDRGKVEVDAQVYNSQGSVEVDDSLSKLVDTGAVEEGVPEFKGVEDYLKFIEREKWVDYESGLLGWGVQYPDKWYMTDLQADAINKLSANGYTSGSVLDFNSDSLGEVIPLMILTIDKDTRTTMELAVVPSKSETVDRVHSYIIPKGYSVKSGAAYDVGEFKENSLSVLPFTMKSEYETLHGVQNHIMGTNAVLMAHIVSESKESLDYYTDLYMKQVTGSVVKLTE